MCKEYIPDPIDLSDVVLDREFYRLSQIMAENSHELWAEDKVSNGWDYGEKRDNDKQLHPCLVPYSELPQSEKEYDINASINTLKLISKLGFAIRRKD